MNWLRCLILHHDWAWFFEVDRENKIVKDGAQYQICKRCDKIHYCYL